MLLAVPTLLGISAWCPTAPGAGVLVRLGITPLATLHHFVHPQWFEDIGAFEKEENIPLYLTWVELAFRRAQTGAV